MKLINLHTHTWMSDGYHPMSEMVQRAYELGHVGIGITDHSNPTTRTYSPNIILYESLLEHSTFPIPVFIGAEIVVPGLGECLLFGNKANSMYEKELIKEYNDWVFIDGYSEESAKRFIDMMVDRVLIHPNALLWCHPTTSDLALACEWKRDFVKQYVHGYENYNHGHNLDLETITLREMGLKAFQNCDAHHVDDLRYPCNRIDREIHTQNDLINWIKEPICLLNNGENIN